MNKKIINYKLKKLKELVLMKNYYNDSTNTIFFPKENSENKRDLGDVSQGSSSKRCPNNINVKASPHLAERVLQK